MRLQQKAVLFTLPFILIPTLVLGWLSLRYTESAQTQIEFSELQTDVNYRVDIVKKHLEYTEYKLQSLLDNDVFREASALASTDKKAALKNAIEPTVEIFFKEYPDAIGVKIFDNSLNELVTIWKDSAIPGLITKSLLQSYLDWHLVTVDDVTSSFSIHQSPWFDNNIRGHSQLKSKGFVQLITQPDWLDILNYIDEANLEVVTDQQIIITNSEGQVIFAHPLGNIGNQLPSQLFDKLYQSAQQYTSVQVINDNRKMNYVGRVLEERYVLLYGQAQRSIFAADTTYTWFSILTVILTILLSPILLYVNFNRVIIEPIEKLASAKRQVAQGNLEIKLDIARRDEIGELFAAFNVMVRQLIVYRENEKESRLRLEYKVKERTEELEKAKELSEQANELKSAFVANISHEIRTPLTAILGFTEQVLSSEIKSIHQKDLLNRVLKSGRHLLALINDILDLSKIESNKLDIDFKKVELFEIIEDVKSILSPQAAAKDLEFCFDYAFPLPMQIWTDETRLKQILINLTSNAIKFTAAGKVSVTVAFDNIERRLDFKVKDTGIGMTVDEQARIFSPFVQADVSISRQFGGTGLGLVISRSLANLLGGDISVTSQVNIGSEFTLNIKAERDEVLFDVDVVENQQQLDEIVHLYRNTVTAKEGTISGKVLVAEDVEDNQYLFGLILDHLHIDYTIVDNGTKAVEMALSDDFDLILMDMQMPVMGGIEAVQLIRASGIHVPIYALTANVMREDIALHLSAGCTGTIGKPVDRDQFVNIVKTHLTVDNTEDFWISDEKMAELTALYMVQLADQLAVVKSVQSVEGIKVLKSECHKIKGSAGSYGFRLITKLAAELEELCKLTSNEGTWATINEAKLKLITAIEDALISEHGTGRIE